MEEQKKVKICFVATYTYALFNRNQENLPVTGLDVQLYNWAIELAKDPRYEIHFLVGDFGQSEKMVIDNVTLWKSSKPKKRGVFNGLVSFIILINILRKIFADIYVDRGASGPISFEVGIFSILSRKKYVHMVASDSDVDGEYRRKSGIFLDTLHSIALQFANGVTYQNFYQGNFLKKKNIQSWKIQNSFPIKQGIEVERDYILWVGSSYPLKRPSIFLDLAKAFPREKFVLVLQKHDENIFLEIEKEAKNIENVLFFPGVPFHEIDSFFEKAKVFVNTSIYEGFPNTFVQSAMCAVPILSLKVDPDSILQEDNIGVVCHDDIDVLRSELSRILEDKNQWRVLSKNAELFASSHFDIKKNVDDLKKMFMNILCE